jgi:outer membrane immunogenic protein
MLRWETSGHARARGPAARQEACRPMNEIRAAVIALAMLRTPLARAEDSAHVTIRGGWAGLGVGANWGDGVLTYEGHEYPFSLEGLSIGNLGAAGFTASGTVHDLRRAEDFNGRYENSKSGGTLVADRSAVTMRNENGVTVDLVVASAGFKLAFRLGGIRADIPPSALAAVRAEVAAARAAEPARQLDASATRVEIAADRAERVTARAAPTNARRMRPRESALKAVSVGGSRSDATPP